MAREPVYRAGNNPGNTPTYGMGSADAAGAAIGRGLQEAGATLERVREKEKARQREAQAADAGVRFAELSGSIDVAAQDARDSAGEGGAGHTAAIAERLDKDLEQFLGTITDERVRNVYRERAAELRARIVPREDGWERGARIDHQVNQVDRTGTLIANGQASSPDPDGLAQGLADIEAQIGLLDLPEDTKSLAIREQQRKVAAAWGNAMVERDHGALLDVIEAGALNPYLEPEDLDRLRSGAMIEGRRLEAAARARRSTEEAEARERIGLFQKRIAAGDMPSEEEFAVHAAIAQTYGLEGQEFDLAVARSNVNVNRETRDWTPTQFDQAINDLKAKGDKASTGELVRLRQLETIRGARVTEFVNDPQGHAARLGNPAPPVDWENPDRASLDRRVTWARGYAQANGLPSPPYLSREEMRPLQDRAEQGTAGRLEVARTLRSQFGAGVGAEIARQLDPDNKDMQLMVGLTSSAANWYERGLPARQRNPKLFDRDAALEVFGEMDEAIPQELRTPVFEAAANIAAAITDGAGNTEFNESTFRTAVSFAMGATGSAASGLNGGVGKWRERAIWLPPGMPQAELTRRISRADGPQIVASAVDERGQPSGRAPRYAGRDGKPGRAITPREMRALELETVSPGVYRLIGPIGGVLVDDRGRPWQFDVRRLP